MNNLKRPFFVIGPNVIESEEHCLKMAENIKTICDKYNIELIFKASFDKANRTSLESFRGLGFERGLEILNLVKQKFGLKILTDIHESWQAEKVSKVADIIQIPAFLCRQTDLLEAAAKTGKIINIKKGQFCSADVMHKSKEKIIQFGNKNVILCERGTMFGYNDLIVDPRNLILLRSATNLVMMDITHCLQQPGKKDCDGLVKSGGLREFIPHMGKMALSLGVDALFMEVHNDPLNAKCDGPTQWPLDKLECLLEFLLPNIKHTIYTNDVCVVCKRILTTVEIVQENIRGDDSGGCKIVKCNKCSHVQLIGYRKNLKSHYDEDSQSNDIIKHFGIKKEDIINKEKVEIYRRIKSIKNNVDLNNKHVLDVGGGYLTFSKILHNETESCFIDVIEPSENRVNVGININSIDPNDISIHIGYLDNVFAENNKDKYDVVTLWHVLEHIDENNIDLILLNMLKVCKPEGHIMIEIPNGNDELLTIEKYRKIFYMIHHISYFTEDSIDYLFKTLNITNYKIDYAQRYDLDNFLNWKYQLGNKCDCNMYDYKNTNEQQQKWIAGKRQNKNTDAIFITIQK